MSQFPYDSQSPYGYDSSQSANPYGYQQPPMQNPYGPYAPGMPIHTPLGGRTPSREFHTRRNPSSSRDCWEFFSAISVSDVSTPATTVSPCASSCSVG